MRIVLSFILLAAAFSQAVSAVEPAPPYKAGAAKVDITPDHAIRLNGFGFRRAESEGVYQKIFAKALVIDDGSKSPVVLMTVDVLGIPADIYDELAKRLEKKAGIKKDRLAIAATHTHTGPMLAGANPTLFGVPIPKEHQANIDKYTPVFIDKLEAVALAALKDMKPAKLEWGVGTVKFAMNRRAKGGPIDHDLPVLFVKDDKGKVRAVYLNYACHCVTLSHNKLGGDWAGYAGTAIEDTFADSVALVAIGGGADQNPNSGVTGAKEEVALGQGREIAAEVKRLSQNFLAPVTGDVSARVTTLELPLAELPTRAQWEEKAKRMDAIGHHARITLAKLDKGEKLPTKIAYPVQTFAFGDSLAMVHLPGELVVDYPLRLKKELDGRRLWVTGYANNAPCYIPSERVLKEGGYEGGGAMIYYDIPAPFKPGLEDKIVNAVKDQISKSFAAKFDQKKTGDETPRSPQQSQGLIKTKPGLKVDLVAAEPLVADPVAIAFGPDGKLWVAEMADYPSGRSGKFEPGGRVVFLEDTNGDGNFDTSSVFLDSLPFPTGVLPWRKGVLICAAPDIIYAEDTNGDGKADTVEKLYSGFGTGNYQARVNSLQYGLDGWIYGSCGLFGGNIKCAKTGKTIALGDRDFRIKPDTGELEPASGRTQQGRVRDDRGNWFGCDNSNLLWHYPLEDHYLRRNPHVTYPNTVVNVPSGPNSRRVFPAKTDAQRFALSGPPGAITAACGLGIYRDDLLGKEFTGNSFTCEPVHLLIHRLVLKPNGSTFIGVRAPDETESEFLASTDNWFRPVHVTTGPDGGLWVADMYRFVIEHPRWIPEADLAKVDVRAGAGLGRIYRVRPADKPVRPWLRLDKLDTAGLVAALDSPNGWQRDMAMMMLVWKNDAGAVAPLQTLMSESERGLGRMQALCTLNAMRTFGGLGLPSRLDDPDPAVRRHAVWIAEFHLVDFPNRDIRALVWKLAEDADPRVRLQVASSLGVGPNAAGDPGRGSVLASLLHLHPTDAHLAAAVVSSLNWANIKMFADDLIEQSKMDGPPAQMMRDLLSTAAGIDNGSSLPKLLATVTKLDGDAFSPWQLAAVTGAIDSLERQGKGWEKLPDNVRKLVEPVVAFARKLSDKENANEADILAAIPLLGRDPATRADDVKRLANLLAASRTAAVQSAAITALSRLSDKSIPVSLIGAWGSASPTLRLKILDSLLNRPAWQAELLAAIEKGTIPVGQMDAARRQRLVASNDMGVRAKAEKLFAGVSNADRQKVIDDYKSALALAGDKTRGKAVFAKSCAACHVLDGVGHAVGPDLAAMANKTPLYLLSEIFDPSRNLDSRYSEYQALTKDERTVVGILAAETATGITLRGQQGKDETILRGDLASLRGTSKSLMPEGLEKDITKQDVADLFAYLTASDAAHKKLHGNDPAEVVASDSTLTLPATRCFIYGELITFEIEFWNIGYWHDEKDHVVWKVRLEKPAEFDLYLDYACAPDAAGNLFAIDGVAPVIRGKVASTGGWNQYKLVKLGTVKLPAGASRITFRPDAPVKGALVDLRGLYFVPVGAQPKAGKPEPAKAPAELAKLILDDATPKDRREAFVKEAIPRAAAVIRAMVADLTLENTKEQSRRIPWIWRVAVAAGRANDAEVLTGLIDLSLPQKEGGTIYEWHMVVLGGGVINGLSLEGVWPGKRIVELIGDDRELLSRWRGSFKLWQLFVSAEKVPTGTRYDALRIVALDEWKRAEPRLTKYLAKTANAELQQGAVSGLVDVEDAGATAVLVKALPDLTAGNRKFAIAGLLRTPERATALLDALEKGTAKQEWVEKDEREALLKHADEAVRARAVKVLGK